MKRRRNTRIFLKPPLPEIARPLRADSCNVFNCAFAAGECSGQPEMRLRANRFHHGHRGGVLALGRATLTLEEHAL